MYAFGSVGMDFLSAISAALAAVMAFGSSELVTQWLQRHRHDWGFASLTPHILPWLRLGYNGENLKNLVHYSKWGLCAHQRRLHHVVSNPLQQNESWILEWLGYTLVTSFGHVNLGFNETTLAGQIVIY